MAALRQLDSAREQLARVQPLEALALTQITLAIGVEPRTELRDRLVQADSGERILQAATGAHVHVHIATGNESHAACGADVCQRGEATGMRACAQQLHRDAHAARKARSEPVQLFGLRLGRGKPEDEALLRAECLKICARERVLPFDGGTPPASDDAAQLPVTLPVDGERD